MGLYACHHPERISKLFLNSPSGFTGIQSDELYNVYSVRTQDKINAPPANEKVDAMIQERENSINVYAFLPTIPSDKRQAIFLKGQQAAFEGYPEEVHLAMAAYTELIWR